MAWLEEKPRLFAWVAGAVAAAGLAAFASAQPLQRVAAKTPIVPTLVPTTRCGGLFLVKVTLDGRGPYTLLLDTGASVTIVSKAVADELLKPASGGFSLLGGASGSLTEQRLHINTPMAGEAELSSHDAITFDAAPLRRAISTEIDGILGFGAFQDRLLILDFASGQVRVASGALDPSNRDVFALSKFEMPALPPELAGAASQPKFLGIATPRVRAVVGGRPIDLIVDSGSLCGIELESLDGLDFAQAPRQVGSTFTALGVVPRIAGRLRGAVELGGHVWTDPILETNGKGATLGVGALSGFLVVIDHASRLAQLSRDGSEQLVSRPVRGTGAVFEPAEAGWSVTKVLANTPAFATGLRSGDRIMKVNGTAVTDLRCGAGRELVQKRDTLLCEVLRDGETLHLQVGVIELVP